MDCNVTNGLKLEKPIENSYANANQNCEKGKFQKHFSLFKFECFEPVTKNLHTFFDCKACQTIHYDYFILLQNNRAVKLQLRLYLTIFP